MFNAIFVVVLAAFFYRLAAMDRRSSVVWAIASLAVNGVVLLILRWGFIMSLGGQLALFGVMWAANLSRADEPIDF
jgi:hypothetical protein